MTRSPGNDRYRADLYKIQPLPPLVTTPTLTREEWIERIERIRAEEAPTTCEACGSTTPAVIERKRCSGLCGRELPVGQFDRDRRRADGRTSQCKDCRRPLHIRAATVRLLRAVRARRAS